eukprot:635369-Amphidinium_carterae.1
MAVEAEAIRAELAQLCDQNQHAATAIPTRARVLVQTLAGLPQALAAMQALRQSRRSLIDVQGLGKPLPLQNPDTEQWHSPDVFDRRRIVWDIIVGAGPGSEIEAWRRLHRRWDPLTTGRARGLLREIIAPSRCTLPSPQAAIEKHCQLNRARLSNYDLLREEVVVYAEARGFIQGSAKRTTGAATVPMDVGAMDQGKGKRSGKDWRKDKGSGGKGDNEQPDRKDKVC